jgi:hypothetical protein
MTPFLLLLLSIVRGVVLDPTGRPVEGAKIARGLETSSTDLSGHFEFQKQYQEALGYSALSRTATGGLRITW